MAVVLVTGGSSGIGKATVARLAAAGDRVFALSRRPERTPLPEGVAPLAFDVADPAAADLAVAAVLEREGRLDALVNNAAAGPLGAIEDMTDATAHHIFETNLFGPMRLAVAAAAPMRRQGAGRIVNVSSMNDVAPAPFGGWYSASKAALATTSVVLGAELAPFGIHVSVVAPGLFRTEMAAALGDVRAPEGSPYAAGVAALTAQHPARLATAGDPDDVAGAIEGCIRAAVPRARVVVGADAISIEKLIRDSTAQDLADLLAGIVMELNGAGGS